MDVFGNLLGFLLRNFADLRNVLATGINVLATGAKSLGWVAVSTSLASVAGTVATQHGIIYAVAQATLPEGPISQALAMGQDAVAGVASVWTSNVGVLLYCINVETLVQVLIVLIQIKVAILIYRFVKSWVPTVAG